MLQSKVKLLTVNTSTQLICGSLVATGCGCSCVQCQNCSDCVDCPNLTVDDILMKVYRRGTNFACGGSTPASQPFPTCTAPFPYPPCATAFSPNAEPAPTYFVQYTAYTLSGNTVCFYIDSYITGACSGQYVGDIFISGNYCSSITMNVGDSCNVSSPYTVSVGGGIDSDLQPSPP